MSGNDAYGYGYGYDYQANYGYGTQQQPFIQQQQQQQQQTYQNIPHQRQPSANQQQQNPMDFLNNPAAQIGVQFGAQALSAGQNYVNSNLNRWISIPLLREYFNVTNGYVFQKLTLIFFPFVQKNWQRGFRQNPTTGQVDGLLQPRDDVNAPDLYIPTMALVTYIILVGFLMGMKNAFHPEILGMTATSCIMGLFFEVFLIKLGCYLLTIGERIHFLDFFAYAGYKFCILIASSAASAFGRFIKYCVFVYCCLAFGLFLIRSLRPVFVPENADALVVGQRRRRINFLLAVVGLEVLSSYILLK